MKSSKADQFAGYAPAPRGITRKFIVGTILALGLICSGVLVPIVMFAMVVVSAFSAIGDAVTASLAILAVFTSMIATLVELIWLLHIGAYVPFAMRVLDAISSLNPR